jgi:hypothetical protein
MSERYVLKITKNVNILFVFARVKNKEVKTIAMY